jgi:hypothetical protein
MNQWISDDLGNRETIKPARLGLLRSRGQLGPVRLCLEFVDSHFSLLPRLGPAIQGAGRFLYAASVK